MSDGMPMSSNRPYLLRALYEWIGDNDMTPHLLVDATRDGVEVPSSTVKDGRVVLNIAARAVAQLDLGNREVRFKARFGGVSQSVVVPLAAIVALGKPTSRSGSAKTCPRRCASSAVGKDADPRCAAAIRGGTFGRRRD